MAPSELTVDRVATGGEGVARDGDGRVVFVAGALPGERVRAEVVEERRRHARARLVEVLHAAPARRPPPCPHVAEGCGGCDWQHVDEATQSELRRVIVADALERLGGVGDPPVVAGPALPAAAARTTVRAQVVGGRAALRRRRSHDPVVVDTCLVAHPRVAEILVDTDWTGADEVTVRVGARTGEALVVVSPGAGALEPPDGVTVVGADELDAGRDAWFHEEAGGRRWRVSARSFFQLSPEAADALVDAVGRAVRRAAPDAGRLVDLCAGVGLFAGTVAPPGAEVVAVESAPSSVADARVNLPTATVVRSRLERWRTVPADVVVADPPRAGLGRAGVDRAVATGAGAVVLVSCDPAAMGRDVRLLGRAGYRLHRAEVLDCFPQTSHVEVVSTLVR